MDKWLPFISGILGAVLVYLGNRYVNREKIANFNAVDVKTLQDLVADVKKLSDEVGIIKSSNRALWSYVYELIDFIKDKDMKPPTPPTELETDPKLKKLFNKVQVPSE